MSDTMIVALLLSNFILLFISYCITLKSLKNLTDKQQSTMYGVSHVWGSVKEFRAEMALKDMMSDLPLPPPPFDPDMELQSNFDELNVGVDFGA